MRYDFVYGQNVAGEYPGVSTSIERITPDVAGRMLETNVHNRSMKREPLKKAILGGEWCLNGASIVFSDDGVLLDGQNRLKACADSGRPIDVVVVRGIKLEAQKTMDVGIKRQLNDWLKLNGYPNVTLVGSIALAMQRGDTNGLQAACRKQNNDDNTLASSIAFVEGNYEGRIRPMVPDTMAVQKKYKGLSAGMVATVLEGIRNACSKDDYRGFVAQLVGTTPPCDVMLKLRNRLEANSASVSGKLTQRTLAALIIKAYNCYIRGESPKLLKYAPGGANPEAFPEIARDVQ